ncbi:hypothetical protein NPIL_68421 [Nephila pilipes]|uniref:Uncharacterized protein n=1 Tax=Nephila pilipes TaxID=299642 RepID=A0A8X6MEU2_NEPPI|nr:hypothetical protein NPIL_68421 [Nephila pilipes]
MHLSEIRCVEYSFVEKWRSYNRKFNDSKIFENNAKKKTVLENFRRIENVSDECIGNIGSSSAAVTQSNVEVIQKLIYQRPWISFRLVATQVELRRMTTHCILCHNFCIFAFKILLSNP